MNVGESLTVDEAKHLLGDEAVVDGLRLRPRTESGLHVQNILKFLAWMGISEVDSVRIAGKLWDEVMVGGMPLGLRDILEQYRQPEDTIDAQPWEYQPD